uniref:40S ribosomal protein S21 n=1 Tax=Panthera tigris altaica TaxID=74533 RepID=A0A8C9K2H7_PANTA
MYNNAGKFMDLYVQQKCSASNHIISAKDHRSIQMNTAKIDKVTGNHPGIPSMVSLKPLLSVGPFAGWHHFKEFLTGEDEGRGICVINK